MHYRLELITLAGYDVDRALAYLDENPPPGATEDDWGDNWIGPRRGLWDWYQIGGRWTGAHAEAAIDDEQISQFMNLLIGMGVKREGLVCGKPTLASHSPEEIDELWRSTFPTSPLTRCPIFDYAEFNDFDVIKVSDLSPTDSASIVFVVADWDKYGHRWLRQQEIWNGMNHEQTSWDGKIVTAIAEHNESLRYYSDEYRAAFTVTGDWVATTIDIHR